MTFHKVRPKTALFGRRQYQRLSACIKTLPKGPESARVALFMAAVFFDDNPNFDTKLFLRECDVDGL